MILLAYINYNISIPLAICYSLCNTSISRDPISYHFLSLYPHGTLSKAQLLDFKSIIPCPGKVVLAAMITAAVV